MTRIKKGINPKFAEIGKIKIGMKSDKSIQTKNEKSFNMPIKLNHFIVVKTERDNGKVNFIEDIVVMNSLPEKPKEIKIMLPFDDPAMNFQTCFSMYQGRGCICRGDGESATMLFLKDGKPSCYSLLDSEQNGDSVRANEYRKIKCDYKTCPNAIPNEKNISRCKPNGRLITIIPASKRLNGYYFFRTTSWNTISFITQALDDMKRQAGGILAGIPAKLFFFKKSTEEHGNIPVVTIDWDFDDIKKLKQRAIDEKTYRKKLSIDMKKIEAEVLQSGILNDSDDPEDVINEFYPENSDENINFKKEEKKSILYRSNNILKNVQDFKEPIEVEKIDEEKEDEKITIGIDPKLDLF